MTVLELDAWTSLEVLDDIGDTTRSSIADDYLRLTSLLFHLETTKVISLVLKRREEDGSVRFGREVGLGGGGAGVDVGAVSLSLKGEFCFEIHYLCLGLM